MPDDFRFLLICEGASRRESDGHVTLIGIVNEVAGTREERIELAAVVGAILSPSMKDKPLDLMAWSLDRNGVRRSIPGYAGTPLILPAGRGPAVLPYSISLPTPERGIYGFELFDPEGAFGSPSRLLATYMFGVEVN